MTETKRTIFIENKKARFDYEIIDSFEAGIVLVGLEIKALREKKVGINGSYVKIIGGEVFWLGGNFDVKEGDRQRTRKLLLHGSEISKLIGKTSESGLTLIPLKIYLKHGRAKLEIGLARGKKKYDKRETIKKRDLDREASRSAK